MTTAVALPQATSGLDHFGESWLGREVTVVGLGRSGRAAGQLLARHGCHVRITESAQTPELHATREALTAYGVEEIELGGHTRRFIEQAEVVVVSPGVTESSLPIQWALAKGLPILSELELAYRFCPAPIVAVTGTNGKSTAVTMITHLLHAVGRSAIACGNVGIPFCSVVEALTPQAVAVVEVSSFQLLWCERFRPTIGVWLNLGTNHLDRHHDLAAYIAAKARLFQQQTLEEWVVLNGTDARIVGLAERLRAQHVWFGENRSNTRELTITPETQRTLSLGAQAVLQVARLLGIPDPFTWQVIRSFRGLEHRLEVVATIRGVHFVNDSKSTTPDSVLYALRHTVGPVALILGGRDKGLDFHPLIAGITQDRVKGLVLIGESRARLRSLLTGVSVVHDAQTLEEAVRLASTCVGPGGTVLFSPGCASFDMFRDFEERGRRFKSTVHHLEPMR